MMKTIIFVAADGLSTQPASKTYSILRTLDKTGLEFGIKINLDYVLLYGYDSLSWLADFGRSLFIDLKMFNGSRTMGKIAEAMVERRIDFFNVMALADSQISEAVEVTRGTNTKVLGVTVLTHFDELYCEKHFHQSLHQAVRHLAETALRAGCDGIILPGSCLDVVADSQTIKVVPGVRPKWYKDLRHAEEIEPHEAKEKGASICVCGSPIMRSESPVDALRAVLSELE